jgi:hypothetical protein
VQHIDRLLGRRVVSVLKPEPFDNSTRLEFGCIDSKKFRDRGGLLGREQALPQFSFAQVCLVHFGSRSNNPQRQRFGFPQSP